MMITMGSTTRDAFAVDADAASARVRTVVVVPDEERADVENRIEDALRGDDRWSVTRFDVGAIRDDEHALAARLAQVAGD